MEFKVNNTFFTGKFLLHLPSVDSTNNYAKELLAKSSPIDGTVILADEQFAGRGQVNNVWQSEPNMNLTFSIIYNSTFLLATEQFYLNMAISLGIWSMVNSQWSIEKGLLTVDRKPPTFKIKWPNDIYVEHKKIAGILIENTISGMHLKYSIIGIGFNVNQEVFHGEINATSMKSEFNKEMDRNQVLNNLLASIEKYYLLLKERKFVRLKKEYVDCLYRFDITSHFNKDQLVIEGKIRDVDEFGNLIIETKEGLQKFGFKEIRFVL